MQTRITAEWAYFEEDPNFPDISCTNALFKNSVIPVKPIRKFDKLEKKVSAQMQNYSGVFNNFVMKSSVMAYNCLFVGNKQT